MKTPLTASFRVRLFGAFLAAALVPLLICSAMLLQIFRLRMTDAAEAEAGEDLASVVRALDEGYDGFSPAVSALEEDELVLSALKGGGAEDTQVYARLFAATGTVREYAQIDLYDREGVWRYSTRNAPAQRSLPAGWGVLQRAEDGGALAFAACEDVTDAAAPLLQGAKALTGRDGERAGYVVISLSKPPWRRPWPRSCARACWRGRRWRGRRRISCTGWSATNPRGCTWCSSGPRCGGGTPGGCCIQSAPSAPCSA